jgi:ABC-type transporter Mla MlaB component
MTCPDLCAVETLCELLLEARRLGCTVRVSGASAELRELIALAGLEDVLTDPSPSPPDRTGGP